MHSMCSCDNLILCNTTQSQPSNSNNINNTKDPIIKKANIIKKKLKFYFYLKYAEEAFSANGKLNFLKWLPHSCQPRTSLHVIIIYVIFYDFKNPNTYLENSFSSLSFSIKLI